LRSAWAFSSANRWWSRRARSSNIRRRGYAENPGGWIEGLAVYAAPVFMHARMIGSIAVALPAPHLSKVEKKTVIEHVVRAAAAVGARMEGRQP
jgi:DNA-binding IclR family transcriptional regulator